MPRVYKLKNGGVSRRRAVIDFIRANPYCTVHTLQEAVGLERSQLSMMLSRLKRDQVIEAHASAGELFSWTVVDDEAEDDIGCKIDRAPMKRIIVKQWTGHKRDAWHRLFFGAAA